MRYKIVVKPTKRTKEDQLYSVTFQGEIIVADSRIPELDACRELLSRGLMGKVDSYMGDRACPSLTLDIATAATLTVEDDARGRPVFRKLRGEPAIPLKQAA